MSTSILLIVLPELARRGYDRQMVLGSLCGAGTLGILIPPSIAMIVYAVAADVSIIRMFLAGIVPGIMLLCMFSGYIIVWALRYPGKTPKASVHMNLRQRIRASGQLIPVLLLVIFVFLSMVSGVATVFVVVFPQIATWLPQYMMGK